MEFFSFKILIHSYSLDKNFYYNLGTHVNVPSFAIQLFDYPTFVIYSQKRLYDDQVGQEKWIKFGNGKSTAFEMPEQQMNNFAQDRPLIINFVDAENRQVKILSKTIVTLQAFRNDLQRYFETNQENWKRKIFVMFDEAKNQVGRIDLSISLAKKRKPILNSTTENEPNTFLYKSANLKPQVSTSYVKTISDAPKQANELNDLTLKDRPRTEGFGDNRRPFETVEIINNQRQNQSQKYASTKNPIDLKDGLAPGPPSLKTIVEGFYCPPIMVFQKKKKTVRFAGNEEREELQQPNFNNGKPRPSSPSGNTKFSEQRSVSFSNNFVRGNSMPAKMEEQSVRPVIVLSNKESERIVDVFNLKESKEENFGLVDALIKELVTLRNGKIQDVPDKYARAESLQVGSLRKEPSKDPKISTAVRKSSFAKESPIDKNKENLDANAFTQSPKRKRLDSFKSIKKSMDISNQIIKETYEEANAPEEEYSQIFESISASQSLPNAIGTQPSKKDDNKKNNYGIDRMESIEESYPEDFEQMSAASASHTLSHKNHNKYSVKTGGFKGADDSRDMISEEIMESGSRVGGYNHSNSYSKKDSYKKEKSGELKESRMSEYSDDFEAYSEDNFY